MNVFILGEREPDELIFCKAPWSGGVISPKTPAD